MNFQIISDSSCDLPVEFTKENNINVVPFYVSFDETNYKKENVEIDVRDFYQKMIDNPKVFPKSSLPSIQDFVEAFTPYVEASTPIICLCITTKFSGSFNSASTAKDILLESYPDAKITVIDTTINTVLQGILVLEVLKMRNNNVSYDDAIANIDRIKSTGRIIFTIGSIDYLKHGGRIGKLKGLAGSTLGIKPLIILKEGEIFSFGISRNRNKSKQKLLDQTKKHFEQTGENPNDYVFCIGYGYDYDEALEFREMLKASLNEYCKIDTINIYQIGAAIGVHTGPLPIGLGLIKKYDA